MTEEQIREMIGQVMFNGSTGIAIADALVADWRALRAERDRLRAESPSVPVSTLQKLSRRWLNTNLSAQMCAAELRDLCDAAEKERP